MLTLQYVVLTLPITNATFSPTAQVVLAIVNLANPLGSDPAEILVFIQANDPGTTLTEQDILDVLYHGKSKGVFCKQVHSVGDPGPCIPDDVDDALVIGEDDERFKVFLHFGLLPSNYALSMELGRNHQRCFGFY